jgi:hypothetical protein
MNNLDTYVTHDLFDYVGIRTTLILRGLNNQNKKIIGDDILDTIDYMLHMLYNIT